MDLSTISQRMPAERFIPSLRRMAAAHTAALVVGFPLALVVILPFGAALQSLGRAGLSPQMVSFLGLFLSYFTQAAALALVQYLFLRGAIRRPGEFILASGLVGVALLPLLFPAAAGLAAWLGLPYETAGAAAGVVFGAALSGVQCIWLNSGRARWAAVSALAWGLAWGVLFPLIFKTIY